MRVWIAEAIAEACPDGADKKMMGKVRGGSSSGGSGSSGSGSSGSSSSSSNDGQGTKAYLLLYLCGAVLAELHSHTCSLPSS